MGEVKKLKQNETEMDGFDKLLMRVQLDCVSQVQGYAEVCMFDPFEEDASMVSTYEFISNTEFKEDIYPPAII